MIRKIDCDGNSVNAELWSQRLSDLAFLLFVFRYLIIGCFTGFEVTTSHSLEAASKGKQVGVGFSATGNVTEDTKLMARKRSESPLNCMLLQDHFNSQPLDINSTRGGCDCKVLSDDDDINYLQQHKKANKRKSNHFVPFTWTAPYSSTSKDSRNENCVEKSSSFSYQALLEKKEPQHEIIFSSLQGENCLRKATNICSPSMETSLPLRNLVSSRSSSSPLGPKCSIKMNILAGWSNTSTNENHIFLKDVEHLLDETLTGTSPTQGGDNLRIPIEPIIWDHNLTIGAQDRKLNRTPGRLHVRRSLVGSFEESLLSGHLASGTFSQKIDGFLAVLSIAGGNFSLKPLKFPFAVTCVDGDNYLLYYSAIDLAGRFSLNKCSAPRLKRSLSIEDFQEENKRIRIPIKGCIQLVLSNPEKTPIHTFFCNYDLSDMPPDTKTFMRHRVILASSTPDSPRNNEHKDAKIKRGMSSILSNTCDSLEYSAGATFSYGRQKRSVNQCLKRMEEVSSCCIQDLSNHASDSSMRFNNGCVKSGCGHNKSLAPSCIVESKSFYEPSKVNISNHGSGGLRYALHIRFLCLLSKKHPGTPQRSKSKSFSAPAKNSIDIERERRFYLYNDMKVVFPQRHSDADEGKLHVEYQFPSDPKYFNINN